MSKTLTVNNLGQLDEIKYEKGAQQSNLFSYEYNALGLVTKSTDKDGLYWRYSYDAQDALANAQRYLAPNEPLKTMQYGYSRDDSGNRTSKTVNGRTSNYNVNVAGQVTSRSVPGFINVLGKAHAKANVSIDTSGAAPATAQDIYSTVRQGDYFYKELAIDNSTSAQQVDLEISAVRNQAGAQGEDAVDTQLKKAFLKKDAESFTHDDDGNVTADGEWTYTYDQNSKLIAMESNADIYAVKNQGRKLEFDYDYAGNRIFKKVYERTLATDPWVLVKHTRFLYNGNQVVAELDEMNSSTLEKTYLYGLYIDEVLMIDNNGSKLYPQQDRQYSVRALADDNGDIVELYEYSPMGKMTVFNVNGQGLTESAYGNNIGYTGRRLDNETGLWYFRARYYSDELGRFLSRDPLGYVDGLLRISTSPFSDFLS